MVMELSWHEYSDLVAQAAGMVSVQADCTLEQASKLIRHYARSTEKTVEEVAASVVDRHVRIDARSSPLSAQPNLSH